MRRALSSSRGFTLLELLVATAIASIVLLVINATFFTALRLHNTTHEVIDRDLELQRALSIVRKDLEGVVLPGNPNATTNTFAGQFTTDTTSATEMASEAGDRVSPDLYTTSGRIDGWTSYSEAQMVSYYLVPANDGSADNKNLVRVTTRNLLPVDDAPGTEQTLLTGVTSATMTFFDGLEWNDTWDSTTTSTLPSAIKLSLVLVPRDGNTTRAAPAPVEIVVPVLVTTTTTAQQEAATVATATP